MSDRLQAERERLSQGKMRNWLSRDLSMTEMVTVYCSERTDNHDYGIYCALIPSDQIEKALSSSTWNLLHGHGLPGVIEYYEKGKTRVEYCRFGDDNGIEPLVLDREFYGIRDAYKEISEEFRLFHRLYHDRKEDRFLKIEDNGNETLVATIESDRVQIRLKELRDFLAVKEMHLAIQFDCCERTSHSLQELGLEEGGADRRDDLICWGLHYGSFHGIGGRHAAFSRLLGKRLIPPLPKEKSSFWGFAGEHRKKYEDFIIDVDENGEEITYTCDPESLANNFGANPEAPHYLTPVQFRKNVLDKYYQQTGKYSVEDSILRCGSLWCLSIDNHHEDRVCVWLGDLGRDLPHVEQLHWRSYNILPSGGVSDTYFRRQILAQFTDSNRPEHVFRVRYEELLRACDEHLGWLLLLPLANKDRHYLQGLRVPATDEQKDFDDLVLGLTKVLVDSLNEKKLGELISDDVREGLHGSIAKLEAAFTACGVVDAGEHIAFLRRLQNLRSAGSAHRKGKNYRKIVSEFGVENASLRKVFAGILEKAIAFLEYLIEVVKMGQLHPGPTDAATEDKS